MAGKNKFYKDTENEKIGGVCAGLADYFGIDPTIIRIGWVVFSLYYGIGVLIYIAAWLILPDKKDVV